MAQWHGTFEEWEEIVDLEQREHDERVFWDSLTEEEKVVWSKRWDWEEEHPYANWSTYYNEDGTSKRKKKKKKE